MYKKIFVFILTILGSGIWPVFSNVNFNKTNCKKNAIHERYDLENQKTEVELGKGINVARDSFYYPKNIKTESSIFKDDFILWAHDNGVKTRIREASYRCNSSYDYKSLAVGVKLLVGNDTGIDLNDDVFSYSEIQTIKDDMKIDFNYEHSSYIYHGYYYINSYRYTLKDWANEELYRSNLSDFYIDSVGKLLNDDITCDKFFQKFGTHIIGGANYGGSYDAYYWATSSRYDLSVINKFTYEDSVSSKLNLNRRNSSINSKLSVEVDLGVDFTKNSITENGYVVSHGGNLSYAFTNYSDFTSNVEKWSNGMEGNEVMVTPSLCTPIWEMLPSIYNTMENVNKVKAMYKDYLERSKNEMLASMNDDARVLTYSFKPFANDKITVQGCFNKKSPNFESDCMLTIDFKNNVYSLSGSHGSTNKNPVCANLPNINMLINKGYRTFKPKIKYEMKKGDGGKKVIGVFTQKNSKKVNDAYFVDFNDTEPTYFSTYSHDFLFSKNRNLSRLSDECLYIRFGGYGGGFNKYYLQNIEVTFSVYKYVFE